MTIIAPDEQPTSVYQYFDAYDSLIYVGITARGIRRQAEHNRDKPWWRHVVRQTVEHYGDRSDALLRESALIAEQRPPFNTQHNPSHARDRATYEAFRDLMLTMPDAMSLARERGQAIPLILLHRDLDRVQFVTSVEFAPIVVNLNLDGHPKAMVDTTRCGMVTAMNRRGGVLCIDLKVRIGAAIEDPFMRLKMLTIKQGSSFEIRNIQLA